MAALLPSVLAPRPFSRWLAMGVAGVLLFTAIDAVVGTESTLAGSLAFATLLVALAGRLGDTIAVAVVAVLAAAGSGAWNGWDVAWAYALGAVVACMALAVLVALLRSSAVTTARRLRLLRDLLGLVEGPVGVEDIVDRLQGLLVPAFGDACAIDLGGERIGVRGGDPDEAAAIGMVLALEARGERIGLLSLALGASGRRYSAGDRAFADLVAGRVAVVLDNAGLSRQAAEAEARLVAALDTLGEAVTMNGPDGRTVYANQAAVELLRAGSAGELTSTEVGEISSRFAMFDEHGAPLQFEQFPAFKALRGEDRPAPLLVRNIVRTTGEERWLINKVTVLRSPDGRIDRVVNVIEDVSEVKRAELTQRLLAEATRVLSGSLDYQDTLQQVAEVAVADLADWCAVDLVRANDALEQVGLAHADPERLAALRELQRRYPSRLDDGTDFAGVLRDGVTVHRPAISDAELVALAREAGHLELLRGAGFGSLLVVPLLAAGRPLGAMTFVRSDDQQRFTDADRGLAEQLGQRAAIAVLNARLYSERAEIARELQQGLLPPQLPDIPGLDVAALYRPAGELNEVGGDFYDAFPTPRGWMVVIGDVAGQGARAAALTGLARFTLRAVGQLTGDPVRAAQQLNRTLRDQPELSLCTAACLLLCSAQDGLTVTTVSCGHPLPALLRGGRAEVLGVPGTLSGAFDDGTWTASTVTLEQGDAVVLYTDGVFDTVGREGRLGQERLIELLGSSPSGATAVVGHVDAALREFQAGPQADDTALVVIAVNDTSAVLASAA
jgi:serine phosphatase RsbU (regulator of sigma subunit)/PAS domain-containing protein